MDGRERAADLARRHIEGLLDEAGRRELEDLLERSPEARREYVREMKLHAALIVDLRGVGKAQAPEGVERRRRRFLFLPGRGSPSAAWVAWAAVAACLLAGAVLYVAGRGAPSRAPVAREVPPTEERIPEPQPPAPPAPDRPAPPTVEEKPPPVESPLRPVPPVLPERPVAPEPPPVPPPPARPAPPPESAVAVARVERAAGEVFAEDASGRTRLEEGKDLLAGKVLVTGGAGSAAVLAFFNGTRLEVRADSAVRPEGGKRICVERGTVTAEVARQPAGQAMAFSTPHAEVAVLGTRFTLAVGGDATRLEVAEGKVRFTRKPDGKAVEVAAGHFVVAAAGTELAAKPLRRTPVEALLAERGRVVVNFGPDRIELPEGVLNDAGGLFDAERGYGWTEPSPRRGTAHRPGTRLDVLRATHVWGGSRDRVETWKVRLPDGLYLVAVCVGDDREQGPQHVQVQGRVVIQAAVTRPNQFLQSPEIPVMVRDGELVVSVGGHGTDRKARGASGVETDDTTLNYVVITRRR